VSACLLTLIEAGLHPLDVFDTFAGVVHPLQGNTDVSLDAALDLWAAVGWIAGAQGGRHRYEEALEWRRLHYERAGQPDKVLAELLERVRVLREDGLGMAPDLTLAAARQHLADFVERQPEVQPAVHAPGEAIQAWSAESADSVGSAADRSDVAFLAQMTRQFGGR